MNQRIFFDWDQERDAYQIQQIVQQHKLPLIGPRVVGPEGFFLPPYYTYILTPFYLASHLHPSALIPFLITANALFFLVAAYVLCSIWSIPFALPVLLFLSTNFLQAGYDIIAWNPLFIPLSIFLTLFSLYRIHTYHLSRDLVLLGLLIGLSLSFHFQYVFLLPLIGIVLLRAYKKGKHKLTAFLIVIGAFLITLLPLFIFDVRHQFINTKLLLSFFTKHSEAKDIFAWIPVFTNSLEPLTIIKNTALTWVLYGGTLCASIFLAFRLKGFQKSLFIGMSAIYVIFPLCFAFYGKRPSEYYFMFYYPLFYLTLVEIFFTTKQYLILVVISSVLIVLNFQTSMSRLQTSGYTLSQKIQAVQQIKTLMNGQKHQLGFSFPPGREDGFHYLIEYYQLPVAKEPEYPFIGINNPPKTGDIVVGPYGIYKAK
ncbi:hypothetical protein HGA88_00790 [Candidatus Roizmanbacteria bacterium]|nr:hypothetical protein [Candidatus Roizmanbacteria bacterium]